VVLASAHGMCLLLWITFLVLGPVFAVREEPLLVGATRPERKRTDSCGSVEIFTKHLLTDYTKIADTLT
jgi:hypothetical protein